MKNKTNTHKSSILGVSYDNLTFKEAVKNAIELLKNKDRANIFFLNSDCLLKAQDDQEYRSILNAADLVLPDGIGLRLTVKYGGGKLKDNCNGTDFSPALMEQLALAGIKIFLLGGKNGVALEAGKNIRKAIPGMNITGVYSGYFDDNKKVINEINSSGAEVLFVAMGVPLQEKWIYQNREALNPRLCLGVGALFDYLSVRMKRAPRFMRRLNLEWLWRIIIDPRRMFKRYIIDGLRFIFLIVAKVNKERAYE